MKIWTRILPILLFLGLMAFLAFGLKRDPRVLPSELIDRQMPEFALSELHIPEATVSDLDFRGHVSLVNVFGSWCAACFVEHPKLVRLSQREDFQLIGINWRDDRTAAVAWLERFGDPYDRIAFDPDSELAIDLGVTGAPETFIVDADGRVRYKYVGIITDEAMRDKIDPILRIIAEEAG